MLAVCHLAANGLEDLGRLLGLLERELRELYFQPPVIRQNVVRPAEEASSSAETRMLGVWS
jgi:hypothetical protein